MSRRTRTTPRKRTTAARTRRIESDVARARIFDAATAEFAAHGFERASTNTIAAEAGVAKGLVFHYFGTKEELYLAIIDRVGERLIAAYLAEAEWPADLFERLYAFSLFKVRVFQNDPNGYAVLAAMVDARGDLKERVLARAVEVRKQVWPTLLAGVDTSRLRSGLTLEQALETINVLSEGLEKQIIARISTLPDRGQSSMEAIVHDVWKHFERLRDGLYHAPAKR